MDGVGNRFAGRQLVSGLTDSRYMKLNAGLVTDPARNGLYASAAIAVSLFVFAYSTRIGSESILVFYAVWLPVLIFPTLRLVQSPQHLLPLLVVPALAALSTLWSDRPDATLRAAIQWGSTVLLGLAAARVTSVPSLARGLLIGGLFVLIYSTLNGEYAYDVVDGTYAFAGAFSSKNQLGLFASITLIAAAYPLTNPRFAGWVWVVAASAISVFAAFTLIRTESATSLITVILAFAVILLALGVLRLPRLLRVMAVALGGVLLVLGLVAALNLGALDVLFSVFGKDATLTGRTYLWSRGLEFAQTHQTFGLGYYSFWIPGRAAAEELWTEFHIEAQTGFHFHNTLIESYVGLGLIGVSLMALWCLMLLILPLVAMLQAQSRATAIVAGLSVLFLIRSLVEIDFFTPYTAGSFLVPWVLLHMVDGLRRTHSAPQHGTRTTFQGFPTARAATYGQPISQRG